MNTFSIMQGRLSPPEGGRLQFFPDIWQAEFSRAKELGFDAITWFLDRDKSGLDPINDIWLRPEILEQIDQSRKILPIDSIDCGMFSFFGEEAEKNVEQFQRLIIALSGRLSTGILSIPLLEQTAPKTNDEKKQVFKNIKTLAQSAERAGLSLALETEMPAHELADFIDSFQQKNIGVCYDTGNATSAGFDCPQEIKILGLRIIDVHLKDRKVGNNQSMTLGTGDTDFDGCLKSLKEIGYRGSYTLQAWRTDDYIHDAVSQLEFIKKKLG